jgi:hypothetical protein
MRATTPVLTLASLVAGDPTRPLSAAYPLSVTASAQMRRSHSVVLMIVGGAALITGAFIDGDTGTIIMAGGGAVGLFGLYQYLR